MQEIISESPREEKKTKKSRSMGIPIRSFFKACARNWYWFVISAVVCGSIALLYAKSQTKLYQAHALIAINNRDSRTAGSQSQTFADLGIASGNGITQNEIYKIRSSRLMEDVVEHLGLTIQYYGHVYLRDVNIYKNSPVQITPLEGSNKNFSITIIPTSTTDFKFALNGGDDWKTAKFGNRVKTSCGDIAITKTNHFTAQYVGFTVIARVATVSDRARALSAGLVVEPADKYSDMLKLHHTSDNYELSMDVLNALIVAYNQDAINDKNSVARNTEQFIAERIEALSQDLSGVDTRIASLRSASASVNMYADASSGIRYQDNAADASVQISLARSLLDNINRAGNDQLIPSNTGITDGGIESQISAYNEVMLNYQKLSATSTQELPVMQEMSKKLNTLRGNLINSLSNHINKLAAKQSQAQAQSSRATGSMVAAPGQEKAIIEVTRQQNVKEQLYLYLLNKREENALQLAITEPNAKVIEPANGSSAPFAPNQTRTILIGILLGLLIPALVLYVIYWILSLDTKIHSRHDIEDVCNIPIVGELPAKKESQKDQEVIVTADGRDRVTEAFRIVRSNLDFVASTDDGTGIVLQLTSTMSGEGKSFIALNLGLTYATVGKRVVVVDLDLRKGRFTEYVNLVTNVGASAYLAGKVDNLDSIIEKGKINENLDIIPMGAIPPNPTALLMGDRLKQLIAELKKKYDYVLLDTVPYGVIADASLINRHVDVTLYIIRDGKVDRGYLEDLEHMSEAGRFKNLVFLVNDIKYNVKNYGYGNYGYGYGYEYSYDYEGEGHEASKAKGWLDRLFARRAKDTKHKNGNE